ncbi:MAG: glutamine--fructose-6-phosphate transaminase (isomerizing) [Clostridia bacterium]|nr:glutamine--fructose-6-phosphate transaminase (isomerizing) [Clostridia bacterium]
MCGIVGYIGEGSACDVLIDGLSRLEYRGYDSAGIAVRNSDGVIKVVRAKGRLKALEDKIASSGGVEGTSGIGHTRWATHGEPSEYNAHPHTSYGGTVTGVHNGIIENYLELREKLTRHGFSFRSDTDTETAIDLVEYYLMKYRGGPADAIAKAMVRIRGSYALALMFSDEPDRIWVARKDSPIIIGTADGESYIASDVPAILKYTRDVYYIGNLEIACIEAGKAVFYNIDGELIEKEPVHITWDADSAEKGGFEHFMIKEIHEESRVVNDTLNSVIKGENGKYIDLSAAGISDSYIKNISRITIAACGSAYHVGINLQYVMEDLARIPVRVEFASEFRYRKPVLDSDELFIVISQSGETADSLAALREAKKQGVNTLGIVNVVGSSIAREADSVFYTLAGPEIAVATTKAYAAQLAAGYVLSIQFAKVRGTINEDEYVRLISELQTIPEKIQSILRNKDRIQYFAAKYSNAHDVFFIGRGIDYAMALEGSLKMKEVSYIHSEAYAAAELKHGTISLIEDGTLVIGILTQPGLFEKTLSNLVECKSRGAFLMAIAPESREDISAYVDLVELIPDIDSHFTGSLDVVPMQLLGYYLGVARGFDVDKPRNLAKSVTVE